jgi:hypothetical protein
VRLRGDTVTGIDLEIRFETLTVPIPVAKSHPVEATNDGI